MPEIQELLTRGVGTEGSLLIPKKIYGTLIDAVKKKRITRDAAALYFGPSDIPGSSVDVNLTDPDSVTVRKIAEGAAIPLAVTTQSSFNLKPAKYGGRPAITKEMQEDSQWNLIEYNIKIFGEYMGYNEDSIVVTDALDNATNTVAGGAAITPANLSRAIQYLEDSDYTATDLYVGPEVASDIRQIDIFTKANESGITNVGESLIGTIWGMKVHLVSSKIMTSTNAYVIDRSHAFVIAEKRPITVEDYDDVSNDLSGVTITQRIAARQLRASAIAKITTS